MKRSFTAAELQVAQSVFQKTLPYDRIAISDRAGLDGKPYTMGGGRGDPDWERAPSFTLNVGPAHYSNGMHTGPKPAPAASGTRIVGVSVAVSPSATPAWCLIHELTHVWQSLNSSWPASYIFGSAINQLASGAAAYSYQAGAPWESYNVEQQASLIADWYGQGASPDSALFPYIRDKILQGKIF
ncbi:hypothetical protein [Viridibacterium curvum]|uniref:Uncharacterized protein n=1 Tax=Viridibacterium curvum TaxID=1101404 RepID=A0ABP9QBF4_9RHOO